MAYKVGRGRKRKRGKKRMVSDNALPFYDMDRSHRVMVRPGVSNLLTKCAKILPENLEWAIIVQILRDVL